jgi:hypothetical protein
MQVTGMLSWSILQFTLTESAMNAVERLDYYGKVEQEAPYEIANTKPPQEWPRTGTIVFENVSNHGKHNLDGKKFSRYLCYMGFVALYYPTFVCTFLCSAYIARIYYVTIYRTFSSLSSIEMGDL